MPGPGECLFMIPIIPVNILRLGSQFIFITIPLLKMQLQIVKNSTSLLSSPYVHHTMNVLKLSKCK